MEGNTESTPGPFVRAFETWKKLSVPKQLGIAFLILLCLAVVLSVLRSGLYGVMRSGSVTADLNGPSMAYAPGWTGNVQDGLYTYESDSAKSSVSTSIPEYQRDAGGVGTYEETAYETRAYSATIKTGSIEETCDTIEAWKPLQYVMFEQATRNERFCSYRFKVKATNVDAIRTALEALEPTDLSVDTESVKRQVAQYDSELDILLRKQAILETTLEDSILAYDELVVLSKSVGEVETLSKVIDSKLAQIERLTQQRVALASQLQQLTRRMAELEDRIEYVYFNVYVEKYEIVDGDAMVDSWVAAMRSSTYDTNRMLQSLTLGLLLNMLILAQVLLYLLALLLVMKYGWKAVVKFWKS